MGRESMMIVEGYEIRDLGEAPLRTKCIIKMLE